MRSSANGALLHFVAMPQQGSHGVHLCATTGAITARSMNLLERDANTASLHGFN
jgi:hypothetical protein